MFFEIKDLELHPIEFAEKFKPGTIDLGPDYRQIAAVKSSGRADLVEEHHGKHKIIQDIRIQGRLSTSSGNELCALPGAADSGCEPRLRLALSSARG